jgi:FkbM family methyltransferase
MRHVLSNVSYILAKSRLNVCWLLTTYFELIFRAFRANKNEKASSPISIGTLTGFTITAPDYKTAVNLFEEIFIHDVYFFKTGETAPVIIDCGSNIGFASLYFKKLYPNSVIMAFEPSVENFKHLTGNMSRNSLSINSHQTALSNYTGTSKLLGHGRTRSLNFTITSDQTIADGEIVTVEQLSLYIDQPVEMVKIDTEGSEAEIINDLIVSGKISLINQMVIEYHPDAAGETLDTLLSKLKNNNFRCEAKKDWIHPGAREMLIYCVKS